MKIIGVSLIIACAGLIVLCLLFTGQSDAKIDPKSIVGIWLFDEGKGDNVKDSSGNGHDGTIIGRGSKWVDGKYGKALEFTGANHVDCGNAASLDMKGQSITLAALVKTDGFPIGEWHAIAQKGKGPGSYQLHFNSIGGFLNWNPVPNTPLQHEVDLTDGKWHYIVAVFNDRASKSFLYLDGKLAAVGVEQARIGTNKDNLRLGADWAPRDIWRGVIDEIAILSKALSEADSKLIMTAGVTGALAVSPKDKLATSWGDIKAQ
jgi:hypothetical protein